MTKARLIETLKARRAEWEAALRAVPEARLCEPGAAGAWSVKDLVVLVVYYEQWWADRMGEALRGEQYAPTDMDRLPGDARGALIHRQHRYRPAADVLAEARYSYRRLVQCVEAQPEALLIEAQAWAGAPGLAGSWDRLREEVCDRYSRYAAEVREWQLSATR